MNMLYITGNLTADPEAQSVQGRNGMNTVCHFTVAVNRYVHGEKVTDYFRITLWNKQAENAMKYLGKGRKVGVMGPVTARAYISNRDGQARCSLEIQDVRQIEYLDGHGGGQSGTPEAPEAFVEIEDDELPF